MPEDGAGGDQLLDQVTVVDFSMVGPGPRCTRILADYGARVVKVRPPAAADLLAAPTYAYSGDRGIERIEVDLKAPAGRQVVERLLGLATVVVESFRPGVAARLGVGYDHVAAAYPDVVYCSVSGYGQEAPAAGYPGHDLNYLGVAGYLGLSGRGPDGVPAMPGASIADAAGGFAAATAVLAALCAGGAGRRRGAYLDVSITGATLRFTQMFVDQFLTTGVEPVHGSDQLLGGRACYGVYETGDGRWMTLGALEPRFWRRFCELAGLADLADHQHDDGAQDRLRNAVAARLRERTLAHWLALLAAEVPVGPVNRIAEVVDDPRLAGTATWEVPAAGGRRLRQLAPNLAGAAAEPPPGTAVPEPGGTQTDALLAELGYEASEIEAMKKEAAVR